MTEDQKSLNFVKNGNRPLRSLYLYEMVCDNGSMSNATDFKFVIGGHEETGCDI